MLVPETPNASGASFLILGQLLIKLFTFGSNQLLVGSISPEVMGVASVLEFYVSFVLFFCRESERLTIQRATGASTSTVRQKIVNFAYIPLTVGVALCFGGYFMTDHSTALNAFFLLSHKPYVVLLVMALILVELAVEPLYALTQFELDFKARSAIESTAVFAKCLVTFAGVSLGNYLKVSNQSAHAVLSFVAGQFAYAAFTAIGYLRLHKFHVPKTAKVVEKDRQFILDPKLRALFSTLFFQMIFKLVLTEGDKIIMGYLFSVSQQGTYAVISNYGSMIARLLFLPIEETLRNLFTRVFSSTKPDARAAYRTMENLLAFYVYFSILLVIGGYFNGSFLMKLLLGRSQSWKATDLFDMFPRYLLYLPFMAFNGILEAFQTSVLTENQIKYYSYFMLFLTVMSGLVLTILVNKLYFGLTGLIIGNITSMVLRIAYCARTYVSFAKEQGIKSSELSFLRRTSIPIIYSTIAYAVQAQLLGTRTTTFKDFFISVMICFTCLAVFLFNERKAIEDTIMTRLRKNRGMKVKKEE